MSAVARMKMEVSPEVAERRARRFWVSFICLILGSNVAMGFFAVYLALSDPSQSVIPNYYQKGLDWDKTKALWAASEKLGWSVQVSITPDSAAAVKRKIRLTVLDRDGKTVEKAMGSLALFHHAHGKSVQELSLNEVFPGVYECEAIMADPGRWEMTLHLKQEETEYLWREEKDFKWTSADIEEAQS
jgi:nitrogen fixation protein FixH